MKKTFGNFAPARHDASRLQKLWVDAKLVERPKAAANEFLLYGYIGEDFWSPDGGNTQKKVTDWLATVPDATEIVVRVNSPGGDVFEGIGIYNAFVNSGKRVVMKIDALAASIASVITCAGDEVIIGGNAMMMIHRASTITWGNAADHLESAAALEKIDATIVETYVARTGGDGEEIKGWMDAETYMTAAEAVDRGFADRAEALKSKPSPPEGAPAEDSAARLAAARLAQARVCQGRIDNYIAGRFQTTK